MSIEPKWPQQNFSRQHDFTGLNEEHKTHRKINRLKGCFDPNTTPEKEKACSQIFQNYMDFAKQYRDWHNLN